ncbi:MAG TPA: peptidylprolyl isomerase [Phycisphaerales bacterium]|nr:peptidylprolyl isomerase [Phycisphaerales bacterium]
MTLLAATLPSWYGCAATEDAPPPARATASQTSPPAARESGTGNIVITQDVAGTSVDARPAAIVNGRSVFWGELRPLLNEVSGAAMLQELILDRLIDDAALAAGITINADDLAGERRLMLEMLHDDPNVAIRLLDELRVQQGLGRIRFSALLKRNAVLRALVRDRVEVTARDIERVYDALYGPKRQARLIVLPSLADARRTLARLENGESFIDLAIEVSTDASAARGGLLEPISRTDPSYPDTLLRTLWTLEPEVPSSPILLDDQYAVLMLVREIDAEPVDMEHVRPTLERRARLNQERLRMEQLARSMMADVSVNVFDESLRESWNQMRRERP